MSDIKNYKDPYITTVNKWQEKWQPESTNIGGGQGDCFLVSSLADRQDKQVYFLKTLKDSDNTERRRRFYIETVIYQSVEIEGIPKIIETNSGEFANKQETLYYISEYIRGENLNKLPGMGHLEENDVLHLFRQLLEILADCHSYEIVHRDVKPENIIVCESDLFLVDFGISYYDTGEFQNLTKIGQEIGNRFLRLPEFAAGSPNKRDERSDLTLAVGIALYMISGEYPRTLMDEGGNYPHQLPTVAAKIGSLKNARFWNLLFDKGFQTNIDSRWGNAEEILTVIDLMEKETTGTQQYEDLLKQYASQIDHDYLNRLAGGLELIYNQLNALLNKVISEKAPGFYPEQQWWVYSLGATERKAETSVYAVGRGKIKRAAILFRAELVGNQVVGIFDLKGTELEVVRVALGEQIPATEIELVFEKIAAFVLPAIADLIS
ncbi:MAG TPA: protein kinase [Mucilaginibacter sp.]|jgi:serine/threonine-protein kinase|nr:protein kinase [Mucilaginibacter sp.]